MAKQDNQDVFDVERIRELIELMKEHDLSEIDLKQQEQEIRLKRGGEQPMMVNYPSAPVGPAPVAAGAAGAGVEQPSSVGLMGTQPLFEVGQVTPSVVETNLGVNEALPAPAPPLAEAPQLLERQEPESSGKRKAKSATGMYTYVSASCFTEKEYTLHCFHVRENM